MRLLRRWISCFLGSDSLIGLQFFRSPFIVTTFVDNRCAGEADVKHIAVTDNLDWSCTDFNCKVDQVAEYVPDGEQTKSGAS